MSRKYMIDRWCVRCGKTEPSPFTKRCLARIMTHLSLEGESPSESMVVDIGCGNCRNSNRFLQCGFKVKAFDMNPDTPGCLKLMLGREKFPIGDMDADIVLANYSLMFLDEIERVFVMNEIKRIISPGGMFIWELYPAKDSFCKNEVQMIRLNQSISEFCSHVLDFSKVFYTKDKGFYSGHKLFK